MVQALQRHRFTKSFSKIGLLRLLGVRFNATWDEVEKPIRDRIVNARVNGDDEAAKTWSDAKKFLQKRLHRKCCGCGCTIGAGSIRCTMCNMSSRHFVVRKERAERRRAVELKKLKWTVPMFVDSYIAKCKPIFCQSEIYIAAMEMFDRPFVLLTDQIRKHLRVLTKQGVIVRHIPSTQLGIYRKVTQ